MLRSPVAHAKIRRIDAPRRRDMPGVLLVLTGDDVGADGLGDVPCTTPLISRDGKPRHDTPRPVLALGKVRHVGQPVALVVAETLTAARDAAEAIEVDYEALPAVTDAKDALAPGAPQLFDHIPGNLVFDWDNDTSDARPPRPRSPGPRTWSRSSSSTTASSSTRWSRATPSATTTRRPAARRSTRRRRGRISCATRSPRLVLKIPKEKLRMITPNVGGGFGMKAFVYPEQALVVWAARKLERPVKWQADRSEGFVSDNQGRDHLTRAELAMDGRGRFLGLRVSIIANLGAYLSPIWLLHADALDRPRLRPLHDAGDPLNVKGVCTNTVTVCAYRGAGRPEAAYLIERLVDAAARELGMSPDAIRRSNFVPPRPMPYTSPTKIAFDSGEFEAVMDLCMENADWSRFQETPPGKRARRQAARHRHGDLHRALRRRLSRDRVDRVQGRPHRARDGQPGIRHRAHHLLQAAGVPTGSASMPTASSVTWATPTARPRGLTGGSRALPVAGAALHEAAQDHRQGHAGRRPPARSLGAATSSSATESSASSAPTCASTCLAVAEAARDPQKLPPGMEPGPRHDAHRRPTAQTFPNGCHIAEVEIDPDTGVTEIERYTVVDDFGAVINPMLLEGQVHGGIVQGHRPGAARARRLRRRTAGSC